MVSPIPTSPPLVGSQYVLDGPTEWLLTAIATARYSILAVQAIQIYEWIVNIREEFRLVTHSAWSSVKVTYLLCRYYPLIFWPIMEWAFVGNHDPRLCQSLVGPIHGLFGFLSLPAGAVLFLRAYAFSGRDRGVLVMLSLSYLFVVGTHVWMFLIDVPHFGTAANNRLEQVVGGIGCFPDYRTFALGKRLWVAMLASFIMNLMSLVIVVYYCLRRYNGQTSLGRYFLKQGLNVFAYTSAVALVSIVFYFKGPGGGNAIGLPIIFVLPDMLACRLILELRSRAVLTESQISRLNSRIVRDALDPPDRRPRTDIWVIED
ncbi:hypothetical protein BKA70DRAFT_470338 [Coprinopsis sp. MPI-PUGE-AT-0042]|nr:hypothetical protein BKA70DRAFT_470338 [Coprinopsis sp. MPI-PUGE-AT-0042]